MERKENIEEEKLIRIYWDCHVFRVFWKVIIPSLMACLNKIWTQYHISEAFYVFLFSHHFILIWKKRKFKVHYIHWCWGENSIPFSSPSPHQISSSLENMH